MSLWFSTVVLGARSCDESLRVFCANTNEALIMREHKDLLSKGVLFLVCMVNGWSISCMLSA